MKEKYSQKVLYFMMFHLKVVGSMEKQVTLHMINGYFWFREKVKEQMVRGSTAIVGRLYIFARP